jgi:hypothetical protein
MSKVADLMGPSPVSQQVLANAAAHELGSMYGRQPVGAGMRDLYELVGLPLPETATEGDLATAKDFAMAGLKGKFGLLIAERRGRLAAEASLRGKGPNEAIQFASLAQRELDDATTNYATLLKSSSIAPGVVMPQAQALLDEAAAKMAEAKAKYERAMALAGSSVGIRSAQPAPLAPAAPSATTTQPSAQPGWKMSNGGWTFSGSGTGAPAGR